MGSGYSSSAVLLAVHRTVLRHADQQQHHPQLGRWLSHTPLRLPARP